MRRIAITSVLVVSALGFGGLAGNGNAGQIYESEYVQCVLDAAVASGADSFDPETDPEGYVQVARYHIQCGIEIAERYASGDLVDPLGPDLSTINKTIKKLGGLSRKLDKLRGNGGRKRTRLAKKAHLKSADPRLHANEGFAHRGVNAQMHVAMLEQLARLEVKLIEVVQQYDAQANEAETDGEKKALKFVALANLLIQTSRSELQAARARQDELRVAIDGGSEPLALIGDIKAVRGQIAEAYNLFSAAQRSAEKAQRAFQKELDRQQKNVPCTLTDPEVPFQGGGTVTISVDGGPVQVLENGTAGISIFRDDKKYFQAGTKTGQYPRIIILHEGIHFRGKGTYGVERDPIDFSDPLPFKPRKGKAHFYSGTSRLDSDFHTSDGGTFTVTKYVLKKGKRRITGTFDIAFSTDDGKTANVTGTFDLCGFQIETREGID